MSSLSTERCVGIVGAGTMGIGIAQVALTAGHPVRLFDVDAVMADDAVRRLRDRLAMLVEKGRMSEDAAERAGSRLSAAHELGDLADAALVIEAIIEDLNAKRALFAELQNVVSAECLMATNTSSISVTAIAAVLSRPERLAGLHFFNPAHAMRLVEVVRGLCTSTETVDTLYATAIAWGKHAVVVTSSPGFIVNRVARPYYGEALRMLEDKVADCATLDALMREGGGFPMGPFELMDLVGLDVNFAVTQSIWHATFQDARYAPYLTQQEMLDAGRLGRKAGAGYYDYAEGCCRASPMTAEAQPAPNDIVLFQDSPVANVLAERLAQRQVSFKMCATSQDGRIAQSGSAAIFVTDGRPATTRSMELAERDLVVIDLAQDYRLATRLAVQRSACCDQQVGDKAMGLLQAAGLQLVALPDYPGLPVMRTVAMLANEAADMVGRGVATEQDVEQAMCAGVNFVEGPLTWAQRIGIGVIRNVLRHLGEAHGEDRYRISPHLHQRCIEQAARSLLAAGADTPVETP